MLTLERSREFQVWVYETYPWLGECPSEFVISWDFDPHLPPDDGVYWEPGIKIQNRRSELNEDEIDELLFGDDSE